MERGNKENITKCFLKKPLVLYQNGNVKSFTYALIFMKVFSCWIRNSFSILIIYLVIPTLFITLPFYDFFLRLLLCCKMLNLLANTNFSATIWRADTWMHPWDGSLFEVCMLDYPYLLSVGSGCVKLLFYSVHLHNNTFGKPFFLPTK